MRIFQEKIITTTQEAWEDVEWQAVLYHMCTIHFLPPLLWWGVAITVPVLPKRKWYPQEVKSSDLSCLSLKRASELTVVNSLHSITQQNLGKSVGKLRYLIIVCIFWHSEIHVMMSFEVRMSCLFSKLQETDAAWGATVEKAGYGGVDLWQR